MEATWLSLLPPLITIALALIFRQVVLSIVIGLITGIALVNGFNPSIPAQVLDRYLIPTLTDTSHAYILALAFFIGGMVALISKNGGMAGVVYHASKYAKNGRRTQLVTWLMGIFIFFDDYANTLIVGNTMRPLTDKYGISREKLAYIVDSTAAPVVSIAFVTTWIGAEVGYIESAIKDLPISESAYMIFLHSLKYSFYAIFTLVFMFILIVTQRDFGPMYRAEKEAQQYINTTEIVEDNISSPLNAIIPIIALILVTVFGLYKTGINGLAIPENNSLMNNLGLIIGNADAYKALLWASFSGMCVAGVLTLLQRKYTMEETVETMFDGFKSMLSPLCILVLTWMFAHVISDLKTSVFIIDTLAGSISPIYIPLAFFLISAAISFATGSSWGAMAILYPILIPLCWETMNTSVLGIDQEIFYHSISVILAGAVLGDHCSPISDTTVLSSLASDCNHINHVRTQLPYALSVGLVACIASVLAGLGINWIVCFGIGGVLLWGIIIVFGKKQTP